MGLITVAHSFWCDVCIGCGKKLNKWNKHIYHNKKCFVKYEKMLDKVGKEMSETNSNFKDSGGVGR